MFVLHLVERLHGDTEQALKSKMQTLCVRMGCSHAMIILCGVCIEQTVFAPSFVGTIDTLCDVWSRDSHNANYVFSGQFGCLFHGGNQKSRQGRREGELTYLTAAGCGGLVRR